MWAPVIGLGAGVALKEKTGPKIVVGLVLVVNVCTPHVMCVSAGSHPTRYVYQRWFNRAGHPTRYVYQRWFNRAPTRYVYQRWFNRAGHTSVCLHPTRYVCQCWFNRAGQISTC